MSNQWLRLWHELPNDPKWRVIARASKQRIGDVIAVYLHLLVDASANATERGRTQSFNSEDVACALDLETEQVDAILAAMQGRVMDDTRLLGWAKRQPEREDETATERKRRQREREHELAMAGVTSRDVTQGHADVTPKSRTVTLDKEEIREEEKREETREIQATPKVIAQPETGRATKKCPKAFTLTPELVEWAQHNAPGINPHAELEKLKDHTFAAARSDWAGTWRNWIRKAHDDKPKASAATGETAYQRSMRERMAAVCPGIEAKAPGAPNVIDSNVIDASQFDFQPKLLRRN